MKPVTELTDGFICLLDRMDCTIPYTVDCNGRKFVIRLKLNRDVLTVEIAK